MITSSTTLKTAHMALKSTIHKVDVSIADMDRHYYADHSLTLAQHPSETQERLMVRLFAFMRNAHERLMFGKGLSTDEEPDLWHKNYAEDIHLWIEVGLPDERRIRKACGRSDAVHIYIYGGSIADKWWRDQEKAMRALDKVSVFQLTDTKGLTQLCQRSMKLQCSISDGEYWISDDSGATLVPCIPLKIAH